MSLPIYVCLYGLDNFYYRRFREVISDMKYSLYGLDNFYYRRLQPLMCRMMMVYTDLIISTIVDEGLRPLRSCFGLYGLDNFYYRRC